jgi:hypothetical protein
MGAVSVMPDDRDGNHHPIMSPTATTDELAALTAALLELITVLTFLRDVIARQDPSVPRLAYRLDELADALGVSRRLIEKEKAAGRLCKPDMHIGHIPLYRPETIRRWIEEGGRS